MASLKNYKTYSDFDYDDDSNSFIDNAYYTEASEAVDALADELITWETAKSDAADALKAEAKTEDNADFETNNT